MDDLTEIQQVNNSDTDEVRYVWAVKGPLGGVHVWAQHMSDRAAQISGARYYGGIEVHRATPADYDDPEYPSHSDCWITGGKCWHDGSSLQFEDQIRPMIERMGPENVASYCFMIARRWYQQNLEAPNATP